MIVVDASALVAIGDLEPDAQVFLTALSTADSAVISAINAVEAGLVLIGGGRLGGADELSSWLAELQVEVADTVDHHAVLAAHLAFGKGRHPARLNIGDCFAYALAKRLDAPLLFKGEDFARTDIRSALQPT